MSTGAQHTARMPPVDDAQLMAYGDGALPPDEARAVADAVAQDAALAARVARLRQAGQLAREALDAPEALAVPPALRAAVQAMVAAQAASAAPTAAASAPRAPPRLVASLRWWQRLRNSFSALTVPMAVACSVFFGVVGFQMGRAPAGNEATLALAVGQTASPALAALLDRLPSGGQGKAAGASVALVASFRDAGGALCRDFSVEAAQAPRFEAVACHRPPGAGAQGWQLRYAAAAPNEVGGYAPASAGAALDSYLASIGAHEPLNAQAEQAALAALTKR